MPVPSFTMSDSDEHPVRVIDQVEHAQNITKLDSKEVIGFAIVICLNVLNVAGIIGFFIFKLVECLKDRHKKKHGQCSFKNLFK